jgi:hypothetical protein
MEAALMQFIPLMIIQLVYALVVFLMARKRGVNAWVWTIGSLVPVIGMFVSLVFFILTMLSILDRLNALETKQTFS